ncbi:MAG TPA: DinB family protein [Candidatus Angelobacter sp.]|nr:DinB family protein [Candidatus Angelobacter sp.]
MPETPQQYTQRILSYSDGKDPLRQQAATAKRLATLIKGKNKKQLTQRPAPGKWSVAEILAHLADAEIVLSWRLRQTLSSNGVAIQAFDQDVWANTFDYAHQDSRQSLEKYTVLREGNLDLLKRIPKPLWDNYGVHQERGNESVAHIVRMVAGHDLNHLGQVERILKGKR